MREALRAGRRRLDRLLVAGRLAPGIGSLVEAAGVPVEQVSPGAMPGSERGNAQGLCLLAGPLPAISLEELCQTRGGQAARHLVVLDEVEDPQNLGAIARVVDAAGGLGLVAGTRRAAPLSPAASRASAGALEWLPVARAPNLSRALAFLKEDGFWVLGADPDGDEALFGLPDRTLSGDLVVVLGAEGKGLRPAIRQALDHRVRIPMLGRVSSLNVSAAGAVILFELMRRSQP